MATINNLMTPGNQIPHEATIAQKLHIRQLVRLYNDLPTNNALPGRATKAVFEIQDIFHLRWLLDESSSAVRPEEYRQDDTEQQYPNDWLMLQGASDALATFKAFNGLLPSWIPTIIHQNPNTIFSHFGFPITVNPLGNGTPNQDNDPRFRHVVRKVVDISFALIISPKSQEVLRAIHPEITNTWNGQGFSITPIPTGVDSVGVVNHFLRILRARFPTIELLGHRDLEGADAEVRPRGMWLRPGYTIVDYYPGQSARVLLNGENVVSAKKAAIIATSPNATATERRQAMKNWTTYLASMSVALAHEFVHLFVVMLAGGKTPATPLTMHGTDIGDIEKISNAHLNTGELNWFDGDRDLNNIPGSIWSKVRGESGFHWEAKVFGGKLVCQKDLSLEVPASMTVGAAVQLTALSCSGRLFFV